MSDCAMNRNKIEPYFIPRASQLLISAHSTQPMLFSRHHVLIAGPAGSGKTNCLVGRALEKANEFRKLVVVSQFDPLYSILLKKELGDKLLVLERLDQLPPASELKPDGVEGDVYLVLDCAASAYDVHEVACAKKKVLEYAGRGVHCIYLQHSPIRYAPEFVRKMAHYKLDLRYCTSSRSLAEPPLYP